MTSPRFFAAPFALLAASTALLVASSANAQSAPCTTDAECGRGFECTEYAMSGCAGVDYPACPPGEECVVPVPEPCPEPVVYAECTPLAGCTADSECADGMVCHSYTQEECSGGEARPYPGDPAEPQASGGQAGFIAPPEEPTCTTTTATQCVPKYILGCTTAADCGDGFDCVPEEQCWCNGSAGGGSAGSAGGGSSDAVDPLPGTGGTSGGAAAPMPPAEECGCTLGPNSVCQAREVPCTMNAECPTGWLCKEVGGYETCGGVAPTEPAGTGGMTSVMPPEIDCMSVPGTLLCVPPYYEQYGGGGASLSGSDGGGGRSNSGGEIDPATGLPLSPPSAGEPGAGAGEEEGGGSKSSDDATSGDDGGCQMGTGPTGSSSTSLLALLGLAGLLRRRRAA